MKANYLHLTIFAKSLEARIFSSDQNGSQQLQQLSAVAAPYDVSELAENGFDSAFKTAFEKIDISGCTSAVVTLGADLCFFRNTRFPFKSKSKIRQVLSMELAPSFPAENALFLSEFRIGNNGLKQGVYPVFSASVDQAKMETVFTVLESYGIRPGIVSPLCLALCSAYMARHEGLESFIFLNPEQDQFTAALVVDKQPLIVRTLRSAPGESGFIREIKQMLVGAKMNGLASRILPTILVRADKAGQKSRTGLAASDFKALAEQIMDCQIGLEENPDPADKTDAGAGRVVPGDELMAALSPDNRIQDLFNFCRGRFGSESFFKANAGHIITTSLLAGLVFVFLMGQTLSFNTKLKNKIAEKTTVARELFLKTFPDKKLMNLDPLLAMQSQVQAARRKKGFENKKEDFKKTSNMKVIDLLYALSSAIPDSVALEFTRLVMDPDRLILSGTTANFNTVDQIKSHIERSKVFKSVEISSAAAQKNGNRVEFKFIVEMS